MVRMKIHVRFLDERDDEYATLCGINGAGIDEQMDPNEETATVEQLLRVPIKDSEEYLCVDCGGHEDYPLLLLAEY